jgi:SAM-dependent methyltransferase
MSAAPNHRHPPLDESGQDHPGAHHVHDDVQGRVLSLDAEVMAEHVAAVTRWLPVRRAPIEIVDLGAGTGAGTFALLRQFPGAQVTAVDSSATHLDELRSKVRAANVGDRVRIVQADLSASEWPDLGGPDLVWASASMHHLADPVRALRNVRDILAPGGLIAIMELAGLPRFLPPNAPRDKPGLEERCHAATQQLHAERMPHRGADWGPMLVVAGFTVQDRLVINAEIKSSSSNAVGPYALAALQGVRAAAAGAISAADLAAVDQLLDPTSPHSILRRDDLAVRTTRTVWAAR